MCMLANEYETKIRKEDVNNSFLQSFTMLNFILSFYEDVSFVVLYFGYCLYSQDCECYMHLPRLIDDTLEENISSIMKYDFRYRWSLQLFLIF